MLTINSLWQAVEIAQAANAHIYKIKQGYAVTKHRGTVKGTYCTSFAIPSILNQQAG